MIVLGQRRARPRGQVVGWAAAAAVAALALAVPLVDGLPGRSGGQDQAASSAEEASGAAASIGGPRPLDGGDLGDLDQGDLAVLARGLDPNAAAARPTGDQPPPVLDQSDQPGEADPDGVDPALPRSGAGGAEAPASEAAPPGASSDLDGQASQADTAPGTAASLPAVRCEVAAREREPGHGPLVYMARARLDGVDAVVLGFGAQASPRGGMEVLVLAVEDCRRLASAAP